MRTPTTLQEAIVYFSDPDRCFEYAKKLRFPEGNVTCPRCGSAENYFIKTRKLWLCRGCNKQFTLKVGTIFEDSALGLDKWMTAYWMLCNCKNGVSSMEIHRTLGITQKSAWFMLQRLRLAMKDSFYTTKLGGSGNGVEVDETFIGGKARNMHKHRREALTGNVEKDKATVVGFLERGGKVRAEVVQKRHRRNMHNLVHEHVQAGAALYTDALKSYIGLDKHFEHEGINHAVEYVRGKVHTNTLENFWSLVKRQLHGTYVSVEPYHLFRYQDEQMFRFNNRKNLFGKKLSDSDRFKLGMSQVFGKRLTYSQLTGKNDSPRHEPTGAGETQVPF